MVSDEENEFQRNSLPGVFTIIDNHLCKSEPFDAANFGLKCDGVKTSFMGNVGVTLHIPEKHDQYRDTDIEIPPPQLPTKVYVLKLHRKGCQILFPVFTVANVVVAR